MVVSVLIQVSFLLCGIGKRRAHYLTLVIYVILETFLVLTGYGWGENFRFFFFSIAEPKKPVDHAAIISVMLAVHLQRYSI